MDIKESIICFKYFFQNGVIFVDKQGLFEFRYYYSLCIRIEMGNSWSEQQENETEIKFLNMVSLGKFNN